MKQTGGPGAPRTVINFGRPRTNPGLINFARLTLKPNFGRLGGPVQQLASDARPTGVAGGAGLVPQQQVQPQQVVVPPNAAFRPRRASLGPVEFMKTDFKFSAGVDQPAGIQLGPALPRAGVVVPPNAALGAALGVVVGVPPKRPTGAGGPPRVGAGVVVPVRVRAAFLSGVV